MRLVPECYSGEMSSCVKYFEIFIRINFVNPTINKYFNTILYMNTTPLTGIPDILISNG